MHYLLNIILLSRWPWYPAVSWRWFEAAFSKHPCYFTQKHFSVAIDLCHYIKDVHGIWPKIFILKFFDISCKNEIEPYKSSFLSVLRWYDMIILMKFHELRNNYDFCTCNVTCRSFIITCLVNETIINIFEHSDQVQGQIIRVSCRLGCPLITLKINNDRLSLFSFFRVTKKVTVSPNCLSVYHKTCQQS